MNRKRLSGQTVAIVILSILLICTVVFGGVYAYYSSASNRLTGKIIMANLKISMDGNSGDSGASEILVTNGYVVPGQSLANTPLTIKNYSNTSIYLAIVYSVTAKDIDTDEPLEISLNKPLISIGNDTDWYDCHYMTGEGEEAVEFRCLVTTASIPETETNITVIEENKLSLNKLLGNEFQSKSISFTFQAYAIASSSFDGEFTGNMDIDMKSQMIVDAIYSYYGVDMVS